MREYGGSWWSYIQIGLVTGVPRGTCCIIHVFSACVPILRNADLEKSHWTYMSPHEKAGYLKGRDLGPVELMVDMLTPAANTLLPILAQVTLHPHARLEPSRRLDLDGQRRYRNALAFRDFRLRASTERLAAVEWRSRPCSGATTPPFAARAHAGAQGSPTWQEAGLSRLWGNSLSAT